MRHRTFVAVYVALGLLLAAFTAGGVLAALAHPKAHKPHKRAKPDRLVVLAGKPTPVTLTINGSQVRCLAWRYEGKVLLLCG